MAALALNYVMFQETNDTCNLFTLAISNKRFEWEKRRVITITSGFYTRNFFLF